MHTRRGFDSCPIEFRRRVRDTVVAKVPNPPGGHQRIVQVTRSFRENRYSLLIIDRNDAAGRTRSPFSPGRVDWFGHRRRYRRFFGRATPAMVNN